MAYTIRPILISDAPGINLLRRMPGVFENIVGIPSENLEHNRKSIESLGRDDHQMVAVTEKDGQEVLIGYAGLTVNARHRLRHSGWFGIMVHADYQNQGIGSALTETILDIADNWLKLIRVELTVFADNERAIHIYEKYGFVKEGVKKMSVIRGGAYCDEMIMGRIRL